MSATDIIRLCDEVLAASKASITPLPWKAKDRDWIGQKSEHDFYVSGGYYSVSKTLVATAVCIVKGNATAGLIPKHNADYLTIAANTAPALAEYVKRLHEAAAAAGVDLDRLTMGSCNDKQR